MTEDNSNSIVKSDVKIEVYGKRKNITLKQKKFAEEYVRTLSPQKACEYAGYKIKNSNNNSFPLRNKFVQEYIKQLQSEIAEQCTADLIVAELFENLARAKEKKDLYAVNNTIQTLAKILSLYKDGTNITINKIDVNNLKNMSDEEIAESIKRIKENGGSISV